MEKSSSGGTVEFIKTVVFALLIALVIRTFAFEPFNIPSGSMKPNLLVGDYLFVSKYSYGYSHHSLPFSPGFPSGRLFESKPERGDVVVFKLPSDESKDYIKRVVGLPGDKIQVINGVLHVNDQPLRQERAGTFEDYNTYGNLERYERYIETTPTGRQYYILNAGLTRGDNTPIYLVPEGHYFAMGDNRDNSADSRFPNVRFIPKENLVGRAEILFFSHSANNSQVWEIWKWLPAIRFSRLFQSIE